MRHAWDSKFVFNYIKNFVHILYIILHIVYFLFLLRCIFSFETSLYPLHLGKEILIKITVYKYLDIGISVGLVSHVEITIGDTRDNPTLRNMEDIR